MKKFNEFRESATSDSEDIRAKAERRAARKQKQLSKMSAEEAMSSTAKLTAAELDEAVPGDGKFQKQWRQGARQVKKGNITLVRGARGGHKVMKGGRQIDEFSFDSESDDFEIGRPGAMGKKRYADSIDDIFKMFEEAVPVAKTSKEKPTAAHPQEPSTEGDTTPPKQGDSEDPKLTHNCATKVVHPKFGEGKPIMGEHAEPDANGTVWWYKVMFEHGIETCETYSMDVLEEGSHGNHKKKGY